MVILTQDFEALVAYEPYNILYTHDVYTDSVYIGTVLMILGREVHIGTYASPLIADEEIQRIKTCQTPYYAVSGHDYEMEE